MNILVILHKITLIMSSCKRNTSFRVIASICLIFGIIAIVTVFTSIDEKQYLTNCTVTQIKNHCRLVRPVSGVFVFPYAYGGERSKGSHDGGASHLQTPEYVGEKKSCKLVNQIIPCYTYGYIDISVTTDKNKAQISNHKVLFGLVLSVGILLILCGIGFIVSIMIFRHRIRSGYEEV